MTILSAAFDGSRRTASAQIAELRFLLSRFGLRGWTVTAAGAIFVLVSIGVPSKLIDSPFFFRMTPIRTQDYAIWAATAVLVGLIAGTFVLPARAENQGKALFGAFLSDLAVGCPICNKLVVLLLGTSGALTFFAPAQLYIGLASLAFLAWTLRLRARSVTGSCLVPREGNAHSQGLKPEAPTKVPQ